MQAQDESAAEQTSEMAECLLLWTLLRRFRDGDAKAGVQAHRGPTY